MATELKTAQTIEHQGETLSNDIRRTIASVEPQCLRTFTPSLAVLSRSAGSYHYTPEGRKLADFTSGVLVANLGHNPTRWWQRVLEYMSLDQLASAGEYCDAVTLTSYNAITDLEAQASERLLQNMRSQPGGARMEQVLWSASGSEGIQKAIWTAMSRKPGSNVILATRNGFHGKKGLAGAVTGSEKDKERDARVRFISFPMEECQSITKRREKLDLAKYKAELDAIYAELGNKICAIITEPYLGGGGSYHPQPEYLQLLEQFCREHDLVFIFDEVQANFGRTGSMYAFTHYGVEPDIVVLGKGLANGMPVDAAVGRADLFANLKYGEGSDTWSGHPLGCAAVLATLDEFEQTDVLAHASQLAKVIEAGLLKLAELPAVAAVRGEGIVWGVEFGPVGKLSPADVANEVVRLAYLGDAQGRAIHLLGPLAGKVIRVAPPLTMALDEAKDYLQALHGFIAGTEG
jgi:4-aminobutyrate aminotransferase/(S)-3-amino-2-methylpropionate transaminase